MTLLNLITIITIIIELKYSPRLGYTRDNDLLLFYGKRKRNYIKLFKVK